MPHIGTLSRKILPPIERGRKKFMIGAGVKTEIITVLVNLCLRRILR